MSYKQQSPLPIIEGGTGAQLFEMALGKQGFGVILSGAFSTSPLEVIQDPGTVGQVLMSNGIAELPTYSSISDIGAVIELTGNSGGAQVPLAGNINIVGDGTTVTVAGTANTLTISAMGSVADSFVTDSGTATPSAGSLTIYAHNNIEHAGSSVSFSGSGNTITFNVTDINNNTIIGLGAGNSTYGTYNTGLGVSSLSAISTGTENAAIGYGAGLIVASGSYNTLIGSRAGNAYSGAESSNIIIGQGNTGILGESNILRIGVGTGTSAGQLSTAFICGIDGVNVGSVATVVTEFGDQLGTAVITAGTGITIIPGANTITIAATGAASESFPTDSGTATPSSGVLNIIANLASLNCGSSVSFSAPGTSDTVQLNVTDGNLNTIIGQGSGGISITGANTNTVLGFNCAPVIARGSNNTIIGQYSGSSLTGTGGQEAYNNILIGNNAGTAFTIGQNNILVGTITGNNYTSNESYNICIGANVTGLVGESNVLRIGSGTFPTQLAQSFIDGIYGITPATSDGIPVFIGSQGQLGTVGTGIITTITGDTGPAQSGAITLTGGTTGASFGGSSGTITMTFAGITANGGTVSLATDATTSTINVGTGAGAKTSTFGSTNTTSSLTLNSGSGGITATGVYGITPSGTPVPVVMNSSGQLGTSTGTVIVTTFTVSGTFYINANTKYVTMMGWSGGSSGGSGRQGASGTAGGGSGGSCCGFFQISSPASFFNAAGETVTIGAGGGQTAGQTSTSTNGNGGNLGGSTVFGNIIITSGIAGKGGTTGTVTAGNNGLTASNYAGPIGNQASGGSGTITTGSTSPAVTIPTSAAIGGGGGGGSGADTGTPRQAGNGGLMQNTTPSTLIAGGAGGIESGTIDGTMGGTQLYTGGIMMGGSGGGGGGGQSTGLVAGNGGKGGFPGAGGGGGGGSINGTTSGKGGAGGDGYVIIIEFA